MLVDGHLLPTVGNQYNAVKVFTMYRIAADAFLDIVEVENIDQKFCSIFALMKFI